MRFTKRNDVYRIIRISGPAHNLLGLQLEQEQAEQTVQIVDLEACGATKLLASDVAAATKRGLDRANSRFKTSYHPARIEFVGSDSPPADIYEELAYMLVERLVSGGSFE